MDSNQAVNTASKQFGKLVMTQTSQHRKVGIKVSNQKSNYTD